jgi:hypothetical protein
MGFAEVSPGVGSFAPTRKLSRGFSKLEALGTLQKFFDQSAEFSEIKVKTAL